MTITVLIRGGLGNQMFQYAAGRCLAEKLGTSVALDLRFYSNATPGSARDFRLNQLPICAKVIDYSSSWLGPHNLLRRVWRKSTYESKGRMWLEPELRYCDDFFDLHDGTTVLGEFNSHLYFRDIANLIDDELHPKMATEPVPSTYDDVPLASYLAVHVRRGDYVGDDDFELEKASLYYERALQTAGNLGFRNVLVFSDDIGYARKQKIFRGARFFVDNEGADPFWALSAMAECGAIVVANSTFSWWAGWFAHRTHQAPIFAPAKWIMGKTSSEMNILPYGWIEIDNS